MYIFHIFRSFLPLHNPIGFGAADFLVITLALLLVCFALLYRTRFIASAGRFAERTSWCMLFLAVLPIVLRLLLWPRYPIPTPGVSDDFSYLLLADTLRHFRLANPPHPLHQFFETFFVLQEPTYSSIFPLGQGIMLALGWTLLGHPWAGVALSIGLFAALCYWMLRAWTTPGWALVGGLLAVAQFGPLNQWMNSYWGGAVSGIAGCLVFGSLPRVGQAFSLSWRRDSTLLGLGLALQWLTRPFEFILLAASVLLFRPKLKVLATAMLVILPALALTLCQNRAVTGNWLTLPYMLSRDQYGVPASFTVQSNPTPQRELTQEQQLDFEQQSAVHGEGTDTAARYIQRLAGRLRFLRFFFLPPLYLALPFFLLALREFRYIPVLLAIVIFFGGTNLYPYFYSHYIAAIACLFVLIAVTALDRLSRLRIRGFNTGMDATRLIVFLCSAHFVFWYGIHLVAAEDINDAMTQYETWDAINHGDPEGRIAVNNRLRQTPGKHLVFVRYFPGHTFKEWVHNAADIDGSRVIWARDLGAAENEKLVAHEPGRVLWLLEPDAKPPRLTPYARPSQ
ncbi:MAG TPA: hypothetical protein VKU01_02480 [Bryobacteraceae bacterium]|nr:hypothetical protein [Bryobacteraceae bacterium]